MAREWYATCKDCGKEFGYSDASYRLSSRRGLSRPERCPNCRHLHSREISTLGLSHFELTSIRPLPAQGLQPGSLGGLIRPERIHQPRTIESSFDFSKFGIKDEHIRDYFDLMQKYQVTVIVAPTGAGKSTFLPFRLMSPPEPLPSDLWTRNGQIVITQPRIQATRNIPAFVAEALHGSSLGAGFDVGFRHSGSPATDWRNKMVYMTDGSLINMIVRNELGRLSVIMIDEAHERSLNIDLILGLLKSQLPRYPHLKLIIASATIDTDLFVGYYGGSDKVGFFDFPGKRQYPVEPHYWDDVPIPEAQMAGRMPDAVADKVFDILLAMETGEQQELITMTVNGQQKVVKGDILAFLHGERPIEQAVSTIRERVEYEPKLAGKVDVLPLYTKLPQKQQDRALKSKPSKDRWRVVVSTNVAETSLTVEGIVHVVDSALINESQWDPQTQTTYVVPTIHSQAGCRQRWGRAGRVQPGIAHCLYTEEQFQQFRKHTPPEILRSPLEQIVLTAKAAGVDDVQNFNWIERPTKEELMRAPHYLRQIGALDKDGDLTDHGLELRSFAADTDVANLMILADRFGCAVEMATLIPMFNLGGYTRLLQWDRGWDAPTKRSVHSIHQGLIAPCLDDVEFYLKLWEAWDGSLFQRSESSEQWARRHFINHSLLHKQIAAERETLLGSLSGHKKDSKVRPINFDLLTRVRIIFTYGLSNQVYQLHNKPASNEMFADIADYRPYIPDADASPELVELHKDAVVEISPESICYNRQLPEFFVCGKRQRVRRRISPQQDPIIVITAAFLTLIKPEWLLVIGQPAIAVARMIASESRTSNGDLIPTTTPGRLFVDQAYPIGASYICQSRSEANTVNIGEQQALPPRLYTRSSYEEIEAIEEAEILEAEAELDATVGNSEVGNKAITDLEATNEDGSLWIETIDEDEYETQYLAPQKLNWLSHKELFVGYIEDEHLNGPTNRPFLACVTGYDLTDLQLPLVKLEIPIQPDPFDAFVEKHKIGSDIIVAVKSVERYVNDWLMYLVVREVVTGLEIVLDPYDSSLVGRNFAIEYLDRVESGSEITVTVEDIDKIARRVRATRLKIAEAEMIRFMGKELQRTVDAVIVDVRENGLYLWLDPECVQNDLPIGAFAHVKQLPQRPEEMTLRQQCRVLVKRREFRKPLRQTLTNLSHETVASLAKHQWRNNISWDEVTNVLTVTERITYDQRRVLLALSQSGPYRRAINMLFRRSNELDVKVMDMTGLQNLASFEGQQFGVKTKVVSVKHDAVYLEAVDGLQARVPKEEAVWNRSKSLQQEFQIGDEKELLVRRVDLERGEAEVTLLKPDENPLLDFFEGQVLYAEVVNVTEFGAFLQLKPGVLDGLVHISEMAWWHVKRPDEVVKLGEIRKAQVQSIDFGKREISLTFKLPEDDPLRKYQVDQKIQGRVTNFKKDGSGAFVELEPGVDGFLYKDEVHTGPVNDARTLLREGQTVTARVTEINYDKRGLRLTIRGLYEASLNVPTSHMGLVIGSSGSKIKALQQETQTYINLDNDGSCVIQGMTQKSVDSGVEKIKVILQTRIVMLTIQKRQIPMLIGKGGSTINAIQNSTGAQINLDNNEVTIIAANDTVLRRTLEQIQTAIYFLEVTVVILPIKIGAVIGSGGSTIKGIQAQTGARIDIASDRSGQITISGNSRKSVDQAIQLIGSYAGYVSRLGEEEGSLPPYHDVRTAPTPHRVKPNDTVTPVPTRSPVPPPKTPPPPQPTRSNTPPQVGPSPKPQPTPAFRQAPQSFEETVSMSTAQLSRFIQKPGFFSRMFGSDKSPLEKIQESTGTRIFPITSPPQVTVTGQSSSSVQIAVQKILETLR